VTSSPVNRTALAEEEDRPAPPAGQRQRGDRPGPIQPRGQHLRAHQVARGVAQLAAQRAQPGLDRGEHVQRGGDLQLPGRGQVRGRGGPQVRARGTSLTGLFGVGPVIAGLVIGDVPDVTRFASRSRFAAYDGTAPVEVSSGGRRVYRLSLRGNRRLNHAIHMTTITQIRHKHSDGRAYYERKIAEGKTCKEALRCLKRRISDAIYARLRADAPGQLAGLAKGLLRRKADELQMACEGRCTAAHAQMCRLHLGAYDHLTAKIAGLDALIAVAAAAFGAIIARLITIPGAGRRTAAVIVAETGGDMARFATAARLAAWAGLAPGGNESAGKRKKAPARKGNRHLRAAMVEAAWAVMRYDGDYLDAGAGYYQRRDQRNREHLARHHQQALVRLGAPSFVTVSSQRIRSGRRLARGGATCDDADLDSLLAHGSPLPAARSYRIVCGCHPVD
jgi:transposase